MQRNSNWQEDISVNDNSEVETEAISSLSKLHEFANDYQDWGIRTEADDYWRNLDGMGKDSRIEFQVYEF